MRSTKIVATLGPATDTPERVSQLIQAGMDVARMNFSHGSYGDHRERIATVRKAAADAGRAVAILQDLQGPKIRTGPLVDGKPVELVSGRTFKITIQEIEGTAERVSTSYKTLPHDVRAGDRILLSDGLIELRVVEKTDTEVTATVIHGGMLKERQGVNLPGVNVSSPGVTDKDVRDLEFGLEQNVDYVAVSFVRRPGDVHKVKELIARAGKDVPVIAKLEKPEAIEVLSDILDVADGVMVARGDLGVELSPEKVPLLQKRIIQEANRRAKPVITATQMLESMIHNPRPTRAEASDVANAVLDGSDAVMLSGETAVGSYPLDAVQTMVRIAEEVEERGGQGREDAELPWAAETVSSSPEAIGAAVGAIVKTLPEVSAVWVFTQSGTTAQLISHQRPRVPILGVTPSESVYRRLALLWGVVPVKTGPAGGAQDLARQILPLAVGRGLAHPGDTVVITGSHPFDESAPTNFLKIQRIGS